MEGASGIWGWGLGGRGAVVVIVLEENVGKWRYLGRESEGKSWCLLERWWWEGSKGEKGLFLRRKGSVSCMVAGGGVYIVGWRRAVVFFSGQGRTEETEREKIRLQKIYDLKIVTQICYLKQVWTKNGLKIKIKK